MTPQRRTRVSTFALKQVMAVTGVLFVGFVVVHMIGNLKVYAGAESLDTYAAWLRRVGYPLIPERGVLWALRAVLSVSFLAHVAAAVTLWLRGRRARGPHRAPVRRWSARTGRFMLPGGVLIAVFVVVHLVDLTIGAGATADVASTSDRLVASFSRPWMAALYTAAMLVVAVHVEHGMRTVLQDFGVTGRRLRRFGTILGGVLALAIILGNALIPPLVLLGVIPR